MLLGGIPEDASKRTAPQKAKLEKVAQAFENPREDLDNDEVLEPLYRIFAIQMNLEIQGNRVKHFEAMDGTLTYATGNHRDNPIVDLSDAGKAKVHGLCLADCLTTAQEAWVLLHVARCYYFLFGGNTPAEQVPVSAQPLRPGQGGSGTYALKDVVFFRNVYKAIKAKREEEKNAAGEDEAEERRKFCHFQFPDAVARVAAKGGDGGAEGGAEEVENVEEPKEKDDDSLGDNEIMF